VITEFNFFDELSSYYRHPNIKLTTSNLWVARLFPDYSWK